MPWSVSIHAESTVVTGVFEMRPVLEGSGRDADPRQRQTAGSVCLSEKTIDLPELMACNAAPPRCYEHLVPRLIGVMPDHWLGVLLA